MKPRIIFIELLIANKAKYICDISERLYEMGKTITVFTKEKSDLLQLDERLWIWKQESFVPHAIHQNGKETTEPVRLTDNRDKLPISDIIIMNDPLSLETLTSYKIVIDFAEVYHSDRVVKSRERFAACRDAGYPVEFLKLGAFLAMKDSAFS